jgi:acetyl esterase/lipase
MSGALAAAPALSALSLQAQGPAPDTGNLRVEKDIVFGKGGAKDLTLDIYRPPAGVTSKRMAIVHLFGGGFFVGNKNALHHQRCQIARRRGYEHLGELPAQQRASGRQIHARRPRSAGPAPTPNASASIPTGSWCRLLGWRDAVAHGRRHDRRKFEGDGGNAGVSSDVNVCIGVYPLASAQIATGLFPQGQATPENIAAASPTSYITKSFTPTIFIHGTNDGTVPVQSSIDFFTKLHALGVPSALTLIQGADHAFDNAAFDAIEVMAQSIDLFLDRLLVNPKPYPSFGGGGRGRGGRGGPGAPGGRG